MIGKYFKVLDYGFISLKDVMGDDEAIEQAARVSYGKGTRASSKTRGLIRYLVRHHHTSPIEMVEFKFHVRCPIFVARQWVRHRTASMNEYSGRYSIVPDKFYLPPVEEIRKQATTNKQGRDESIEKTKVFYIQNQIEAEANDAYNTYIDLLDGEGLARELARIVLPVNYYTEFYWKIDLHNLLHFIGLRADEHAQKEIRDYAIAMGAMVRERVPYAFEAWYDYRFSSISYSRYEQQLLRKILIHQPVNLATKDIARPWLRSLVNDSQMSDRELEEFMDSLFAATKKLPDFVLPEEITDAMANEAQAI